MKLSEFSKWESKLNKGRGMSSITIKKDKKGYYLDVSRSVPRLILNGVKKKKLRLKEQQ